MEGIYIKKEAAISALIDAWELSFASWSTISSFLTARSKKYYSCTEEVLEDLEKLNNKDLSELFESVF